MLTSIQARIAAAILSQTPIVIGYKGENRAIEPHTLGKNGMLRAWQFSEDGSGSGWKLFDTARITEPSFQPRAGYKQGDRAMTTGIIAEIEPYAEA